jgi:hypothetical protein
MNGPGRTFIVLGLFLLATGLLINFAPKLPPWLGRLPGDITFKRGDFGFYFPLATCLLLSAVLSFVLWLFRK